MNKLEKHEQKTITHTHQPVPLCALSLSVNTHIQICVTMKVFTQNSSRAIKNLSHLFIHSILCTQKSRVFFSLFRIMRCSSSLESE